MIDKPHQFTLRSLFVVITAVAAVLGITAAINWNKDVVSAAGITLFAYSLVALPIYGIISTYGSRRAIWTPAEMSLLSLPWMAWFVLMFATDAVGKSLANLGVEPWLVGLVGGLLPLPKVLLGPHMRYHDSLLLGALLTIVGAAAVFFFTPSLPE